MSTGMLPQVELVLKFTVASLVGETEGRKSERADQQDNQFLYNLPLICNVLINMLSLQPKFLIIQITVMHKPYCLMLEKLYQILTW